jgi:hypothetical protein
MAVSLKNFLGEYKILFLKGALPPNPHPNLALQAVPQKRFGTPKNFQKVLINNLFLRF